MTQALVRVDPGRERFKERTRNLKNLEQEVVNAILSYANRIQSLREKKRKKERKRKRRRKEKKKKKERRKKGKKEDRFDEIAKEFEDDG